MKHILVAVDGSISSFAALQWGADLAHRADADLWALRAWVPDQVAADAESRDQLGKPAHRELETWCEILPLPVEPDTFVVEGDAATGIIDATSRQQTNLLVIGTRAKGASPTCASAA